VKRPTYQLLDRTFSGGDFQFAVGQTYRTRNTVDLNEQGFVSWDYPLFMFSCTDSLLARYALNEVAGSVVHRGELVYSEVLSVRQELQLDEVIDHAVAWALAHGDAPREISHRYGGPGLYLEKVAASDGDHSWTSAAGARTSAVGRGVFSSAATAGFNSIAASSGENSGAAAAGATAIALACGPSATAVAGGHLSRAAASGPRSKAVVAGEGSRAECTGAQSVAAAIGRSARAKASAGGLLVLVHYDVTGNPLKAVSAIASEDGPVKPDVWYKLDDDGRFVQASEFGVIVRRRKPTSSPASRTASWRLVD
jgi:hypothetical protein